MQALIVIVGGTGSQSIAEKPVAPHLLVAHLGVQHGFGRVVVKLMIASGNT